MFVALGVAIFLGISWSGPALKTAADTMYREGQLHSFQVQFPYGLTEADLARLGSVEGVSFVEPERQSFQILMWENKRNTVKVQSLGQQIDTPIVREGTLPQKTDEIAFHAESANLFGVGVGDTITFVHDVEDADGDEETEAKAGSSDGMQYLKGDTFTIAAIIDTADYIAKSPDFYGFSNSPSGTVEALAWVADSAFDASAFEDGYPIVNVRCDSLADLATFTKEYEDASAEIGARISELGEGLSRARYEKLHGDAQSQLDEAERKMKDAKEQIADGERQVKEGEDELVQGRAELDRAVASGEAELARGLAELRAGEEAKAQAEADIAAARSDLDSARSGLDMVDGLKSDVTSAARDMEAYKAEQDRALGAGEISQLQYNDNLDASGAQMTAVLAPLEKRTGMTVPLVDHTNYGEAISMLYMAADRAEDVQVSIDGEVMTVGEARTRVAQYERELADAQRELDEKTAELDEGWKKYRAGEEELRVKRAEGERKIADGEAELEYAKRQLQSAKDEVAKNEPRLAEARDQVAALRNIDWAVLPRSYNTGGVQVTTFADVTGNLSISMAALFIIVGLLVSYFAMNRMVHEEIAQIGMKKALGFRTGEVTLGYLLYAGIAVLAGAIVGSILAYFLVEGIIGGVFGTMFAFGSYPAYFGLGLFLIITILELVLVVGTTFLACRKVLKREAVDLLRGESTSTSKIHFYEKWAIWNKLGFFVKVIINNCVNDKRRMASTIVGVAGSTALIVTAITLSDNVLKSYDRHYENVYGFNTIAYVNSDVADSATHVETALEDKGAVASRVFAKRYLMEQPNGTSGAIRVVVPFDVEDFSQVYHVSPTTDGTFDLSGEGAWVSQAYGTHLGAKVGDVLVVDGGDGTKHEVPILGFYEFWLSYHEMVMGPDYYKKEFGSLTPNAVFAQTDNDYAAAGAALSSIEGFDTLWDDAVNQYANFETFSTVSTAVVIIYLVLAALMSVVVLLNLNIMFINEKKRELIVLMINGFTVKDAKRYVSNDSIVLTALGIIVGIYLGCIMGSITVASIEPETGVFIKDADLWAMLFGVLGSSILAFIMGKIALRRVPKLKLIDINRM